MELNEHFYLSELENKIQSFIDEHCESLTDDGYGYFGDKITEAMAAAAWNVILYGKSVNQTVKQEQP